MKTKGSVNSEESLKFRRLSLTEKYKSIIAFCEEHTRIPKTYPKPETEYERVRGQFIINKKSALKRGELPSDETSLLDLILVYGKSKLTRLEHLINIKNFVEDNKRLPRYSSKNPNERQMASHWYNTTTIIKNGKKVLSDKEYLMYMEVSDKMAECTPSRLDKLKLLLNWCRQHGRTPRQHIESIDERRMANLLTTFKQNRRRGNLTEREEKVLNKIIKLGPTRNRKAK